MASITEKIDTRSISRDANGQAAGTRTFTVTGVQSAAGAVLAWEDLAGGRVHPDNPFLVFDRVDVVGSNGNTVYTVRASYSTFKGGRRQQDPLEPTAHPFFGWQYAKVDVSIPLAYQIDITTRAGDQENTKTVWTAELKPIAERRVRRTLKVGYTTSNSATLDVIAEQDRKIHRIRGVQYLFMGAEVSQNSTEQTEYVITYTWELDRGTFITPTTSALVAFPGSPLPDPGNGIRNMYIVAADSAIQTTSGAIRIRQPYHTLDMVAARVPTDLPRAVEFLQYETDDEGWQSLPGMVPL